MKTEYTKMKYYHIILPLLVACLLGACTAEGPEIKDMKASSYRVQLGGRQRDFSITAKNGSVSVSVEANCFWTVTETSDDSDAFSCSPTKGEGSKTLNVTAADNTTVQERKASYRFTTADGVSMDFHVTQAAGDISLNVTPTALEFESKAEVQTKTFMVTCNTNWEIKRAGDFSWFSIDRNIGSSGDFTITVTTDERQPLTRQEATLTITSGSVSRTVTVSRMALAVTFGITPQEISVSALGETVEVQVTSNTAWTVKEIVTKDNWISPVGATGATGSGTLRLQCDENKSEAPRTAVVTIGTSDGTTQEERTCTITQQAGTRPVIDTFDPVSTSRTTANVNYAVSSTTFPVTAVSIDYVMVTLEEGQELTEADFEALPGKVHKDASNLKSGTFSLTDLVSGATYAIRLTATNKVGDTSVLKVFETQSQPGKDDNTPPGFDDGE